MSVRGIAVLLRRFALGSRLSFFLCQEKRDGLRHLAFLFRGSRSPFARSRGVGAVVGRGGNAELVCGSVRFLSRRLAFGLCLPSRFHCGDLPSAHVCPRGSIAAFAFGSRLSFFLCQEKRDGLRCLAFLFRRVEIAIRAFSLCLYGYLPLAGSLRVWPFLYGDLDGLPGCGERGYGDGGAAFVRFCASTLALQCFPRGVRWGCAPQTAPKSLRLSGLSSGAGRVRKCVSRGGVALVRIRRACTLLRSRIGTVMLSAGSTLGLRTPDCAKESNVEAALPTLWTLFTLRRGCVGADSLRLCVFA